MNYIIEFTKAAQKQLQAIEDRRIRQKIVEKISTLATDPEKQGKPLSGDLQEYRSIRAVGQRYRIIYHVREEKVIVTVVAVGIRKASDKKDIYQITQRMFELGLLEETSVTSSRE